jgi:hypothetical protein
MIHADRIAAPPDVDRQLVTAAIGILAGGILAAAGLVALAHLIVDMGWLS